ARDRIDPEGRAERSPARHGVLSERGRKPALVPPLMTPEEAKREAVTALARRTFERTCLEVLVGALCCSATGGSTAGHRRSSKTTNAGVRISPVAPSAVLDLDLDPSVQALDLAARDENDHRDVKTHPRHLRADRCASRADRDRARDLCTAGG